MAVDRMIWPKLLKHAVVRVAARARLSAGRSRPINRAIIEITTSSSINVKPDRCLVDIVNTPFNWSRVPSRVSSACSSLKPRQWETSICSEVRASHHQIANPSKFRPNHAPWGCSHVQGVSIAADVAANA